MRRFSLWLRGQPFVADALLAGGLFVIEILVFVSSADGLNGPLFLAFSVVLTVPVAWRRRFPRSVAAVALVSTFVADVWGAMVGDTSNGHPAALALPIMLYTLVAYVGRAQGAVYAAGVAAYSVSSLLLFHQPLFTTLLFSALLYALSWVAAEFLGARRAYDEAMEARLIVAEYDRDRRAEEAVLMERTRIARELHDVVAHGVSVMVVQADGASYAIRRNPERAEQAVANISATGRQALAELRRTVALLRTTPDADDMPEYGRSGPRRGNDESSRPERRVGTDGQSRRHQPGDQSRRPPTRPGIADERSSARRPCPASRRAGRTRSRHRHRRNLRQRHRQCGATDRWRRTRTGGDAGASRGVAGHVAGRSNTPGLMARAGETADRVGVRLCRCRSPLSSWTTRN